MGAHDHKGHNHLQELGVKLKVKVRTIATAVTIVVKDQNPATYESLLITDHIRKRITNRCREGPKPKCFYFLRNRCLPPSSILPEKGHPHI